ncbi:2OG-Fe(II) oxygenase [Azohydromonas caseinilytica]|uniref:2-oxoglutarate-dependent dioxygenase n=1 Tax=Azohydromonas caseinilytica TaxID=2728836 RepID=A0A848F6B6_9BURK|nr:2OG-Fe(II) oxygenase [Azohydromonas caseinilytica]NML14109.1 2-oxoglutarate-dependent dioxygenase [Azohydromonas caseinilytica]
MSQQITPELRQWIIDQARAGHRPEAVLAAMRASGWDEATAMEAMESTLQGFIDSLQKPTVQPAPLAKVAVPEPALESRPSTMQAGDRQVQVLMTMENPRVVVFGGLLSDEECDQLIELARPRLARSETVDTATGGSEVNAARTSSGMFFGRGETALHRRIEERIAALVNWPVENGEGLQILRYGPGAEYRPHHDYFDPEQPGTPAILQRGGQRVGTVVMYLNTPAQGGGTTFPDVGLEVAPFKGNAVFFSYERPHPDTRTLHGGAPVLDGEKWVATKWLRERVFV